MRRWARWGFGAVSLCYGQPWANNTDILGLKISERSDVNEVDSHSPLRGGEGDPNELIVSVREEGELGESTGESRSESRGVGCLFTIGSSRWVCASDFGVLVGG